MKALVIGSGIGGLATGIRLRHLGFEVMILEKNKYPGGKLTELYMGDFRFDAGPSLFTLPHLVSELFELFEEDAERYFQYEKLEVICKYFYPDQTRIEAFSDIEDFANEIENNTSEKSATILKFLDKAAEIYGITSHVFLERSLHKIDTFLRKDTLDSVLKFHKINSFKRMHSVNAQVFNDERVVQLFDRYATYNGSDPYQAPATLNVIAHLEHNIGAFLPKGGIHSITQSLFELAKRQGIQFEFGKAVDKIRIENDKALGIEIDGRFESADLVVSNADVVNTYQKLLPDLRAPDRSLNQPRSSSALIFYWGMNRTFDQLDVHNILFSDDYKNEFNSIWKLQDIPDDPTIYIYVSSKMVPTDAPPYSENWFVMINVPPNYDQDWSQLIPKARASIIRKIGGMLQENIEESIICEEILDPLKIEQKTSSYRGALYGNSSNNMFAAFLRHPNFHRKIKNLYFCGGSVHPGGGIPLCLLSAKIIGDLVGRQTRDKK